MKNSKEYKEIYNEIERIVRSEGDLTLNIENFINKILKELDVNSIDFTVRINQIPRYLIEKLYYLKKEEK